MWLVISQSESSISWFSRFLPCELLTTIRTRVDTCFVALVSGKPLLGSELRRTLCACVTHVTGSLGFSALSTCLSIVCVRCVVGCFLVSNQRGSSRVGRFACGTFEPFERMYWHVFFEFMRPFITSETNTTHISTTMFFQIMWFKLFITSKHLPALPAVGV